MATDTPSAPNRQGSPDQAAPTTDFALIEEQKENIRPLASGRSAATLGAIFDSRSDEAARVLEEGVERFRKQIAEAERREREGEDMEDGVQDVLDLYHKYILFYVQHCPSSTSDILPILESTTKRFVEDVRYSQDTRYLKMWTMFARHVERREEIWAFLNSREIGTRHASLYEEWAMSEESIGRKKKADEVYRMGIARKAAPLERLKNRHQAFLTRIMAPPSGIIPDDDPVLASRPARSILGQMGRGGLPSVSGATAASSTSRTSKGKNGSKLEVFTDGRGPAVDPESTLWEHFGTRDSRRKENIVEATPWKGETLPQKRPAPRTPKLEVFKDSADDNPIVHRADEVLGGIRTKQPLSEAELIRANPLRNFDLISTDTPLPDLPAPKSARKPPAKKMRRDGGNPPPFSMVSWECPRGGPETKLPNGKLERRMFDWDATFRNNEEWSFEEVRAHKLGLLGKNWKELKDWERGWHKPGSTTPRPKEKQRPPSPTVNTKLANAEVMSLFNQTIHGGKIAGSDSDESDSDDDDEEDDVLDALPTPLPPRVPVSMMTPGGVVPPTPTPAPGHGQQQRHGLPPQTPTVFADENATPSSGRLNIFSDENAQQASTRKIRIFSDENQLTGRLHVFSDENADLPNENAPSAPAVSRSGLLTETPARTPRPPLSMRPPLGGSPPMEVLNPANDDSTNAVEATPAQYPMTNVFATPAPSAPIFRPFSQNSVQEVNGPGEAPSEHDDEDSELPGSDRRSRVLRRFATGIHEMTPITERTFELTTTTGRSSGRISIFSDDGGDEPHGVSQVRDRLSAVAEEEERSSCRPSAEPSPTKESFAAYRDEVSESAHDDTEALSAHQSDFDRSGVMDSRGFGLPEGYTIMRKDIDTATHMMDTLAVVDRTIDDVDVVSGENDHGSAVTGDFHNPCNPADDHVISTLLRRGLPSDLQSADHRPERSGRLSALQKDAKSKLRRSSASVSRVSIAPGDDVYVLQLGSVPYEICSKLGEGGFGAVFLGVDTIERAQADARMDDSDSEDDADVNALVAIKVESPASMWEAVMLERVRSRVSPDLANSIIRQRGLHLYDDESFLLLDYAPQGTLLDVVNKASAWGLTSGGSTTPDELLAIFFTIELLKLVEGLHDSDIIHGDLKIDNCLVRLEDIPASEGGNNKWSVQYCPDGSGGWSRKGVCLIDFGRAADLTLFPAGRKQMFVADWKTDPRDCPQVRNGEPWSYEADYFGLASICYCLLFGKYIGTETVGSENESRYKIDTPLKRYWQTELWNRLFEVLLNPHCVGTLPITNELGAIRSEFEEWLQANCDKNGKQLRQLVKKIQVKTMERRL